MKHFLSSLTPVVLTLFAISAFTGCDQPTSAKKKSKDDSNTAKKVEVDHKDTLTITNDNFEDVVLKSDKLVMVDFWAEWCGPCKMLTPTVNELATQYKGQVVVGKLDVDSNKELAIKYEASSIPLILFFKDGEVVERLVGLQPKENFESVIDASLNP